ncbi:MAG: NUDIX domain-containing protein [Acidimicrobiia bacterium]
MSTGTIKASGGVVVRPSANGVEVLVIHRPHYDDWSLPKGKDDPGETPERAALRELHEETGYRARIVTRLGDQHYTVNNGRPKTVVYFVMRPTASDGFKRNAEVDEIRWVALAEARQMLSYEYDRDLLDDPRIEPAARSGRVYLIRHAHAGDRAAWDRDDRLRPITKKGRRQSDAIAAVVSKAGVDAIYSSPYVRCVQTVQPLAKATRLDVIEHEALSEGADSSGALELVTDLAGHNVALCSHGDVIPDLLDRLARRGVELRSPTGMFECRKGSIWELAIENGVPVVATYREPPGPD